MGASTCTVYERVGAFDDLELGGGRLGELAGMKSMARVLRREKSALGKRSYGDEK
jgi:hypothetical protein